MLSGGIAVSGSPGSDRPKAGRQGHRPLGVRQAARHRGGYRRKRHLQRHEYGSRRPLRHRNGPRRRDRSHLPGICPPEAENPTRDAGAPAGRYTVARRGGRNRLQYPAQGRPDRSHQHRQCSRDEGPARHRPDARTAGPHPRHDHHGRRKPLGNRHDPHSRHRIDQLDQGPAVRDRRCSHAVVAQLAQRKRHRIDPGTQGCGFGLDLRLAGRKRRDHHHDQARPAGQAQGGVQHLAHRLVLHDQDGHARHRGLRQGALPG